jgi:hypothetical protein
VHDAASTDAMVAKFADLMDLSESKKHIDRFFQPRCSTSSAEVSAATDAAAPDAAAAPDLPHADEQVACATGLVEQSAPEACTKERVGSCNLQAARSHASCESSGIHDNCIAILPDVRAAAPPALARADARQAAGSPSGSPTASTQPESPSCCRPSKRHCMDGAMGAATVNKEGGEECGAQGKINSERCELCCERFPCACMDVSEDVCCTFDIEVG